MCADKPSWIDYLNLAVGLSVGAIGVGVAVTVSKSADRLSANNLMVTTATFLLDDSERRRNAGMWIYTHLKSDQVYPDWGDEFVSHFLSQVSAAPQSDPSANRESQKPLNEAPDRVVATQVFDAVAGTTPRLFIEIADEQQRSGAEALRRAIHQVTLEGQSVIAPGVEKVTSPPNRIELRVLKISDRDEADKLAATIGKMINASVHLSDLSGTFDKRPDVKRRTYELWFPPGATIALASPPS